MAIDREKEIAPPEWFRHRANLKNCDVIAIDGDACIQHLERLLKVLFSKDTKLETIALSNLIKTGLIDKYRYDWRVLLSKA